jgi:acyl-CoA thioesterase-1
MRTFSIVIACLTVMTAVRMTPAAETMVGESLILSKEAPGFLLADTLDPQSVIIRSTYLSGGTIYELGRDYRVDAKAGTIARVAGSRIPDFSTNVLFERKDFDHGQFAGYGNGKFFVYVDYKSERLPKVAQPRDASTVLARTAQRLRAGKPLKLVAFGDSITAGGEASSAELQYPSRYAQLLRDRYPQCKVTLENTATGGDNTIQGLARLDEKVLSRHPDLVLIGFGMNDHNLPGVGGVPVADFKENLKRMVNLIREKTRADVILLSTFPPHPDWHFGSHQMERYAHATEEAAKESAAAYADVFGTFQIVLARKDPSSLLGNNINHPNDFGHWLYLEALDALQF